MSSGLPSLPAHSTLLQAIELAESAMAQSNLCYGHGYENPQQEAAILAAYAVGVAPDDIDSHLGQVLNDAQQERFHQGLIKRCVEQQPLAYITGDIWFNGLRFLADSRALVPRSLLAQVLNDQLDPWFPEPALVKRVLDLCTGGASLAIMACKQFTNATVVGSDISQPALDLAQQNRLLHDCQEQLQLIQSDLFSAPFFADQTPRFDLIICNPPYVNQLSVQALPPEFLAEPEGALGSGIDGMDLIRKILAQAAAFLTDDGIVLLEIGHEAEHFFRAFPKLECLLLPVEAGEDMVVLIERRALLTH